MLLAALLLNAPYRLTQHKKNRLRRLSENGHQADKIPASNDAGIFLRHLTGDSRHQSTLLPDTLDDYVDKDNPVRVIDAFVDILDVSKLGFSKADPKATGRKPYHPADLLGFQSVR
jgi:transposase